MLDFQCRLDQYEEAIADADTALKQNRNNTKAISVKAEALFGSGQFEKALVYFEMGYKIRKDAKIFQGISKCRQAILSTLGDDGIVFKKEHVEIVLAKLENTKEEGEQTLDNMFSKVSSSKEKLERTIELKGKNLLREEEIFLRKLYCLEALRGDFSGQKKFLRHQVCTKNIIFEK